MELILSWPLLWLGIKFRDAAFREEIGISGIKTVSILVVVTQDRAAPFPLRSGRTRGGPWRGNPRGVRVKREHGGHGKLRLDSTSP